MDERGVRGAPSEKGGADAEKKEKARLTDSRCPVALVERVTNISNPVMMRPAGLPVMYVINVITS